jgi:uncharacterized protein (UPF0210 family)
MSHRLLLLAFLALGLIPTLLFGASSDKPKVRAITAFVKIDRSDYNARIAKALTMLRKARAAFESRGYEVQTIRITTQPFPEYTSDLPREQALGFLKELDGLAAREQFTLNLGPAMLRDNDSTSAMELLAEALLSSHNSNASVIVAADDGIHWKAIGAAAHLIKYLSEHSLHSQATFSFAATAMLAPYGPFFPGSYHTGPGGKFAVGFEGAIVVEQVFASGHKNPDDLVRELSAALTQHARAAEDVGQAIQKETGWEFLGVDPTPAPLGDISIGAAIERYLGAPFGSSGTLTAASVITQAVKAVPVKQVGYSGLMVPVLEDKRLAERWSQGSYHLDSLLSYSAVCGTGLDAVPLPGSVSEEQLARILGDVASLAVKWHKPLTARLQPVAGKKAGEKTEFDDPRLVNTTLQPLP